VGLENGSVTGMFTSMVRCRDGLGTTGSAAKENQLVAFTALTRSGRDNESTKDKEKEPTFGGEGPK